MAEKQSSEGNSGSEKREVLQTNHKIDLAREFILKTNTNIFLTGKAGTGKTTFLRSIIHHAGKRAVVAAPTGVAALNAGGVTLHSLFQIPFGPIVPGTVFRGDKFRSISRVKQAIIRSMELLIIDEISMVRCDVLDKIEDTLRKVRKSNRPFGGVQLLLIGDVQQLAPICRDEDWKLLSKHYNSPYFFDSLALRNKSYVTIELDEIFRQRDPHFTNILNAIRENRATSSILKELNRRFIEGFEPPKDEDYITLTTHNNSANAINRRNLDALTTPIQIYEAKINNDFPESAYPNDTMLELKVGAQVLFIKNDMSQEKLFYNGMLGQIVDLDETSVTVRPKSGAKDIVVEAIAWENLEYSIDGTSGEMSQNVKGTFSQIPLKCAWAITIHKSQGLSFDHAVIDAAGSFAHGQVYVALSRCRTLEGMVLKRPISLTSIIEEQNVEEFNQYVSNNQPTDEDLELHKKEYFTAVICDMFDFESLQRLLWNLMSEMTGVISKTHSNLTSSMIEYLSRFDKEVGSVGKDFQVHLRRAVAASDDYNNDAHIIERLKSATGYFKPRIEVGHELVKTIKGIDIDAELTRVKVAELTREILSKMGLLQSDLEMCEAGFSLDEYHEIRAKAVALDSLSKTESSSKSGKGSGADSGDDGINVGKRKLTPISKMENEKLYKILLDWREAESAKLGKRANSILSVTSMIDIQQKLPITPKALSLIKDFGRTKITKYGAEIIKMIKDYCEAEGIDPLQLKEI